MAKQLRPIPAETSIAISNTTAASGSNYQKRSSKAGKKKKMEGIRKGFLYEPTKEFNEIDQGQQLDITSNNFPKANEE